MVEFNAITGEIYKGSIFDILANLDAIRKTVERVGSRVEPPKLDLYPVLRNEECSS
jgi:hypothetical protein